MTTSAYPALTNAQQIFKDLVFNPIIRLGEGYIERQVPFFSLPIIKNLEEGVIEEIADYLFSQLVLFMDVTAIKLVNAEHQAAYDRASIELAVIAEESGIDSAEFKTAREAAKIALSLFTRLPGT